VFLQMGGGDKHKRPRNTRTANWKQEDKKLFIELVLEYLPEVSDRVSSASTFMVIHVVRRSSTHATRRMCRRTTCGR
jgi:hypothetical protein